MRPMTRARRIRWIAGAAVLLAAGVAGALWWRAAGSSTPVSPEQALGTFRSRPGGAEAAGTPRPGVYAYRASGSERGGLGALTVGRALPSTARMVVTTVAGGWEAELLLSQEHIEGARYVRDPDGAVYVTWHRTKITFAGVGRDDVRDVVPRSLSFPADLRPGRDWTERYTTGDIHVVARSRVMRSERVDVAGTSVEAAVVATHAVTDGPHPGTRDDTVWWAPSLGVPVRWDIAMDIGGTFGFTGHASIRLESTQPAT